MFPERIPAKTDGDETPICAACGASGRDGSKFCPDCGKQLSEDYQPLDAIRSSYGMQRKTLKIGKRQPAGPVSLFTAERNAYSETAWACVVYSMVPYIGILFVPVAFTIGGIAYAVSQRRPNLGGQRMALACVGMSFGILVVQVFLWWLLYIIPELGL